MQLSDKSLIDRRSAPKIVGHTPVDLVCLGLKLALIIRNHGK